MIWSLSALHGANRWVRVWGVLAMPTFKQMSDAEKGLLRKWHAGGKGLVRASGADQLGQCQRGRGSATWGSTSEGSSRSSDPSEGSISEESIAAFNWKNT